MSDLLASIFSPETKALHVVRLADGRWQASRQNHDNSFTIGIDADAATALKRTLGYRKPDTDLEDIFG